MIKKHPILTVTIAIILLCFGWLYYSSLVRIQHIKSEFQREYPNRVIHEIFSGEGWSDYVEYHIHYTEPPGSEEKRTMWVMEYIKGEWVITDREVKDVH